MPEYTYTLFNNEVIDNLHPISWAHKVVTHYIPEFDNVRLFGSVFVNNLAWAQIHVNEHLVWDSGFQYLETTIPVDVDVTAYITPGDNLFRISVCNLGGAIFTLHDTVTYTTEQPPPPGEPKDWSPPEEKKWYEKLVDYIPYMVVGGVIIGGLAYLSPLLAYLPPPPRRRRE